MTFFCYLDSSADSVLHMEPLEAMNAEDARREAQLLLRHHASAHRARIYLNAEEVAVLAPDYGDQ